MSDIKYNTTITVKPSTDELLEEYNKLAFMNEIPNMATFAFQWMLLSVKAYSRNRPALGAMAESRAKHYSQFEPGEYIKLVEGPLAEMIMI